MHRIRFRRKFLHRSTASGRRVGPFAEWQAVRAGIKKLIPFRRARIGGWSLPGWNLH